MRFTTRILTAFLLLLLTSMVDVVAQTKYWVGGNGEWSRPVNWSHSPQGPGGAGVPRASEDVVVEASVSTTITLDQEAWCRSLVVRAVQAPLTIRGAAAVNIAGSWSMEGRVSWNASGPVNLVVRREGVDIDTRGIPMTGDVVMNGSGSWSVISDLNTLGALRCAEGTLIANASRIRARAILLEGRGQKRLLLGSATLMLDEEPDMSALRAVADPGSSMLVIDGDWRAWGGEDVVPSTARDINVCGTGPGQTPFTVNAQLISNFNGFGVRCRGGCNGTVTATVTGGSGNFTYQWLNGGPPTATWNAACGGPQLVVVTDVGQGISCPAQVNVTEPAPVGVIFFGPGTPPSCAGVCDGTRTALAIGGVSPHTYNWNNGAGTSSSFNALCPGVNTLRITDFNGCVFDTTFTFNIQPIVPNLSLSDAGCFGECSGTASVAPTGGSGMISATWAPGPIIGQGTFQVSELCAGPYSVTLVDANGCDTTLNFTIEQPPPILVDVSSEPANCAGTCDGSAEVLPSGALGPFSFEWSPEPGSGQGTNAVTGLCAGLYSVRITDDASGCDTLVSVPIDAPPAFDVQSTVEDASCANTCDGSVDLEVDGGTMPYAFLWTPEPAVGQGSSFVSGLCPGMYEVLVSDAAGCDTLLTFNVDAPPPLDVQLSVTDISCAGVCDGSASATVSGGVPDYTYLWTPSPTTGQGTSSASGFCAGPHTLLVTDANGCDTTLTFEILEPDPLLADQSQTNVSCGSLCDGTASVTVSGGTPDYDFIWTPAPPVGQGTSQVSGLCAGDYEVSITDANGCVITRQFSILDAVPLMLSLQLLPATCPNTCDGSAGVIVTGGQVDYAYLWTPEPGSGQGTANVTGLCPQAYSLTVTDAVGCDTTISFTISAPDPIEPNILSTDVSCAGLCNGTIATAPTGGNGSYSFSWSPDPPIGQGTANAGGLCAGDWSVTITSGGCDTTVTVTILEPLPIEVTLEPSDASCFDVCDGTCGIPAIAGGTPPYAYLWAPGPVAGQGTPNVSGLCPGSYSVTVSDAAGCDTTLNFEIVAPPAILPDLSTTPETCDGPCTGTATVVPSGGTGQITADWQPEPGGGQGTFQATGLCANIAYQVTLSDANGCDTTIAFMIMPSGEILPNSSSTPVSCNGQCDGAATVGPSGGVEPYTYDWSPPPTAGQGTPSASGYCAGEVLVTITDATGCSIVAPILITEPPPLVSDVDLVEPLCTGICTGSIGLTLDGGQPPFTFVWSPPPPQGQGTGTISELCAGIWSVIVSDASGCSFTDSYTITEPPALTLDVETTESQCQVCAGTATATFGGGIGDLDIAWFDGNGVLVGSTNALVDLCAGEYTATVTDDNGCTISRTVFIDDTDGEVLSTTDGETSCPGVCDGIVSVSFVCSVEPCTISWSDADGNDLNESGSTLSGLCAGTYFAQVTNGSGCVATEAATVSEPIVVTLNVSTSPVSCAGVCDATATVGLVGGTPPFIFNWSPEPGAGQSTPSVSGLCAGVYEVAVTDGDGCVTTQEVLIIEPAPLSVFNSVVIGTSCAGVCDGNVTLVVDGGTPAYSYQWSPEPAAGQGSPAAFGFCAGVVEVTITDMSGCTLVRSFTINEPQALQASASSTPSSCPDCDGTGSITVQGGTAPYTFSWTLGGVEVSTDQAPTGLCGGVYSVRVTDAFGCFVQLVVLVQDGAGEVLETMDGMKLCSSACDASVSVDFDCSVEPCTIVWSNSDGDPLATDVTVLTDLCEGVYTVQVTNGAGCVSISTAAVFPSITLVPNLSSTPASCTGVCDGTATVGPFGGIEPYTYFWSPEPIDGQGTPQVTGLCAGVYEVLIQDDSGCDTTVSVLIVEPDPLEQEAVLMNVDCNGSCTGSIAATPTGGIGPYTFLWTPEPPNGQGSNNATGLCAGGIDLSITDANGCISTRTWSITEPPPLTLNAASVSSTCGVCDGEASVEATGGTAPYGYIWSTSIGVFGTDPILPDLCAGLYSIQVTDSLGCTVSQAVPVQDLGAEVLNTLDDTTSCPGVCDGSVEVLFDCGQPDCSITWYDVDAVDLGVSSNVLGPVCVGTYIVQVTNGLGCLSFDTALVEEPPMILPNLGTTAVTCFGDCDGTATVGPTGGVPPYEFNWDPEPPIGQGTPQAEGLCAGPYTVTISDAAGCAVDVPVLILGPELLTATLSPTPITCNGACDGAIAVTAQGGNGGNTFTWTPEPLEGQGTELISSLCADDWSVLIMDVNGCDTTLSATLVEPTVLEVLVGTTDIPCFGDCIGEASATITGGQEPYSIEWSDANGGILAMDTLDINELCAGDYELSVVDANGCIVSLPFSISQGSAIDAALAFTTESCFGPCDASANVAPTGGAGSFSILWGPEPIDGQGTEQVSNLCAGNYSVTITDVLLCDTTISFTILPYTAIMDDATVSDVICNGDCDGSIASGVSGGFGVLQYVWTPEPGAGQGSATATELCPAMYSLQVTDAFGCDSVFMYTINEPTVLALNVDLVVPASCNDAADGAIGTTAIGGVPPYTWQWTGPGGPAGATEDLSELLPGTYDLRLTDANGCTLDSAIVVGALVSVVADAGPDGIACIGTTSILDGSNSIGAVTYEWVDDLGNFLGDTPVIEVPVDAAGERVYTLTVSDGPCSSTDQILITALALPIADAGPDQTIFLSETVTLGGIPAGPMGSTFSWRPDSLVSDPNIERPSTSPLVTTWFVLDVVGPNGCTDSDSVLVTIVPTVVIPTGFTPNSDGSNDTWVIDFIELFPDCEVEVYNRWGEQLFRSVGYGTPWDGKYRDGFVPVGTYYYVIELNDERFPEPYTGPLTVIR